MLAKVMDASPAPLFLIDKDHKVICWNTAIEGLLGIKRDRMIGTDEQKRVVYAEERPVLSDLIVEGAVKEKIEAYYPGKYQKSQLIGGAYEAIDFFPNVGINGKWLHFSSAPIKNSNGETIAAIETAHDITELKKAEEEIRYYVREITRIQEEERKRIAHDLHDDTVQLLFSLSRHIGNFVREKHNFTPNEISFIKSLQAQLNRGIQSLNYFIRSLRPFLLDDLGLIPALKSLAKDMREYHKISTDVKVLGEERHFSAEAELLLFRIVQEGLNNIKKHAQASEVQVVVEFVEDRLKIFIIDNGQGFELKEEEEKFPYSRKLGLVGMQERARLLGSTIEIKTVRGKGTTLTVNISSKVIANYDESPFQKQ